MKTKNYSQTGFAHQGLLLLVLVAAVIGYVGYKVANNKYNAPSYTTATTTQPAQTIQTKADLDKAAATLNSANVDSDLNPNSLNQDVQSLL